MQGEIPTHLRQQVTFLYCDDIAASEAFYRDKLGLPLVGSEDTPVNLQGSHLSDNPRLCLRGENPHASFTNEYALQGNMRLFQVSQHGLLGVYLLILRY